VSSQGLPGRGWLSTPEVGPATYIPGDSFGASVSCDGRYVAFVSLARDLVPGDPIAGAQVYMRDLVGGATRCITAESSGLAAANPCTLDQVLGVVDCPSIRVHISSTGGQIGIQTSARLVPSDQNACEDIYVAELAPGLPHSASLGVERKAEQTKGIR
jgi:hypothetical protein